MAALRPSRREPPAGPPAGRASSTTRQKLEELAAVLPRRKRVLIIPHNYPDPDALASAAAIHLLLARRFGVNSRIAFTGEVSRAENKELLRRLRFRWHYVHELRDPRAPVPCIFVDTAPWSRNVTLPAYARPVAVIDHHRHPVSAKWRNLVLDIRAGAGATTTVAYEYLRAADVSIPRWLAAIMAYAIATETTDLSRGVDEADHRAYTELVAGADLRLLGRIRHAPLPQAYFAHLREAVSRARRIGNLAWTHLEHVEQPEIVAEIADLLLRMEGARWAFCSGFMPGGLFLSLRSSVRTARCSRLLRAVAGPGASAGGHDRMAAAYVPLETPNPWDREEHRRALAGALIRRILRRRPEEDPDPEAASEPVVPAPAV